LGGVRQPICDSIRLGHSCSYINAPLIYFIAGYAGLKTVGIRDVGVFMVGILGEESLLPQWSGIDA
jgi:hypothetical protein